MKKFLKSITALLVVVSLFAFTAPVLRIAPQHSIKFSTFGVSGVFKTFTGVIQFDERNLDSSKFNVTIDVNSIKTSFDLQDKHAKGEEWFNAAKYPSIRFVSKKVVKTSSGYAAAGTLNVHGISKEISLPFTYKANPKGGLFEGSFTINRNDFKVGEPGGMVGDELKITVSVPVVK